MRGLLIVLDSAGVGGAPDASKYGDEGANTLGHILAATPTLRLPTLFALGLGAILDGAVTAASRDSRICARYGRMRERSQGKDTTTGHWEIAGVIVGQPFAVFERFPDQLVAEIASEAGVQFIGNYARSGTTILEELGCEHVASGRPILYTSADSVMQIAAHEEVVPLDRLYEVCAIARRHCDRYRIGRVIARPFVGAAGQWRRTSGRHDYSMVPPRTVLNAICDSGREVIAVGKIADIFAGSGISESHPTESNLDGMAVIEEAWNNVRDGLIVANLVDFDMLFGHRRDVDGYARALEEFDSWLDQFLPRCEPDDLVIVTADHGNDPTFRGTDHTREEVPVIVKFQDQGGSVGVRDTFADVAATLARFFRIDDWRVGTPLADFSHDDARSVAH